MTRVFDINGIERNLSWLANNYDGCHPRYIDEMIDLQDYSHYFQLVAIYCTTGPAVAKIETIDSNGQPISGNYACFSWSSLSNPDPSLPDLSNSGVPFVWTSRGIYQRIDHGITGFGLGPSYGPFYQSWILSPSTPSDCLVGGGMKGGTHHEGPLHAVFAYIPVVSNPDPPTQPNTDLRDKLELAIALPYSGIIFSDGLAHAEYVNDLYEGLKQ
jgi:hypothetical protein